MKEILKLIEKKKEIFAREPFFEFLGERSIEPRQRLTFVPCLAPFVMGIGDLNKYVFRCEPTNNKLQKLINQHTYEDESHWIWFLEDLEKLELDLSLKFSDTLRFLWSEETLISRHLNYQLYQHTFQADPLKKLIVLEVVEATGNVFLSATTQVARELKAITKKEYQYLGSCHLAVDSNHSVNSSAAGQLVKDIQLIPQALSEAIELVENIFEIFTNFTNELLTYARKHNIEQPLRKKKPATAAASSSAINSAITDVIRGRVSLQTPFFR